MSFRLPTEMRDELTKAAKDSGRSVTQELLHRLGQSFKEDRKNYRDPATKGLCILFADLAENVHAGTPDWRSDPFLFKAFTVGAAKLLATLTPPGKPQTPQLQKFMLERLSSDDPMNKTDYVRDWRERLTRTLKSPEAWGEAAADNTLAAFFKPSQRYKEWEPWREELDADPEIPGLFSKAMRHQENNYFEMDRAQRSLKLKPRGKKS
jgi:hypothetical protein